MANLNICQFIGNVGSIETRYLPSGEAVVNLSLAVNETWKDKSGEKQEHTEWVRVSIFGKLAEVADKYVNKGDPLYISGILRTRKWQDKDGKDQYTTEIRADRLQMLGGKKAGDQSSGSTRSTNSSNSQPTPDGGFDDDIPF